MNTSIRLKVSHRRPKPRTAPPTKVKQLADRERVGAEKKKRTR